MSKPTYYFSHDFGARNDPKLIKLLMKHGQEGKGVYWDLVEMLYEQNGKLELSDIESYAFSCRTNTDLMHSLINDFGLFENDNTFFWSNTVLARIAERENKSVKYKKNAEKRWGKQNNDTQNQEVMQSESNSDAIALQSESNCYALKEKKGKEKKENKSINTNVFNFDKELIAYGFKKELVDEWKQVRKLKRKADTQTGFNKFIKEIELTNHDKNEVLEIIITKSWGVFKNDYDWRKELPNNNQQQSNGYKRNETIDDLKNKLYL